MLQHTATETGKAHSAMTEHSRQCWVKIPLSFPKPLQLPLAALKHLGVNKNVNPQGLWRTMQFEDPQPTPHFTMACSFHHRRAAAVWGESLLPLGAFREKLPAIAKGKIPQGGEEVNRKSWGWKVIMFNSAMCERKYQGIWQAKARSAHTCWLSGLPSHEALRTWGSWS